MMNYFRKLKSTEDIDFNLSIEEWIYYIKKSKNLKDLLEESIYSLDEDSNLVKAYYEFFTNKRYNYYGNMHRENITKEEEIELFKKSKNGDEEAFNFLVENNIRLVDYVIMNFKTNMDKSDLMSFGIIGLINAVKTFDYKKELNFRHMLHQ